MSFYAIKGQDRAVGFLRRALESGRTAHAYLFMGPEGVGKRMAAINFAKALNCQALSPDRPCDACASCKKIDAHTHPDVRVVVPLEDKTAIGIGQVRDILKDAALKPYEGRRKVYIIDGAGRMQHVAQSAFLKTLEEPSPETVFILIAERPEDLFPTILSRSEVVMFLPLSREDVKEALVRAHGVDPVRAHILSGITSGRIGEAVRYATDEKFFDRRAAVLDGLLDRTFFGRDGEKLSKEDLGSDLDVMLTYFRDILITKAGAVTSPSIVNVDRNEAIAREANAYGFDHLDRVIREILSTGFYLDANVNAKLAMSVLGMEIDRS